MREVKLIKNKTASNGYFLKNNGITITCIKYWEWYAFNHSKKYYI